MFLLPFITMLLFKSVRLGGFAHKSIIRTDAVNDRVLLEPDARGTYISFLHFFITISMASILFVPTIGILFRFASHYIQALFSFPMAFWYFIVSIALPCVMFFILIYILNWAPWWKKTYMFWVACIIEFWISLLFFLIAKENFTYIEYFFQPIIRMSLLIVLSYCLISTNIINTILVIFMFLLAGVIVIMALYAYLLISLLLLMLFTFLSLSIFIFNNMKLLST